MKKTTILAAICMMLVSFSGFAQGMGGGGMGGGMSGGGGGRGGMGGGQGGPGQGQGQQQQRSIDIDFIGATGYFEIDSEEAIKKMKIKNSATKAAVTEIISDFIVSCQDVVDTNRKEVDNLEFAKENIEAAEGDMTALREIMKSVTSSRDIVRPILVEKHKTLSARMEEVLNEKEKKRWDKYYKSVCNDHSFDPNAKERPSRTQGEGGERPEGGEGRPPMM